MKSKIQFLGEDNFMKKPNVLYILADDLGWADVGFHGSQIDTPNLDRLVETGIELTQHYVSPLCTPTRTGLLSGIYPGRFGQHATVPTSQPVLPDGFRTMANLFRESGYATGLFGKWHLGSDPKYYPGNYGFDYSYGSLAGGIDPYTHRYKKGPYSHTWHRNGKLIEEKGHATDLITDEAINWLENQNRPWFLYLPYTAVHRPIRVPESWIDHYQRGKYDENLAKNRSFKKYAAYVSHMDYSVGRLIETLKCQGQLDNTIIVFASDNGAEVFDKSEDTAQYPGKYEPMPRTGSNYPLRGCKGQMYEGGIRTPAIISWQGKLSPGKLDVPIQIEDWLPTFAALLNNDGLDNERWDGQNILPLIVGKVKEIPERELYWNLRFNEFALRSGNWKIIYKEKGSEKEIELYNIADDPLERKDLTSEKADIVNKLINRINKLRELDDSLKRDDIK